jgi:asparagine synthase (glutamine-hydrolysing)
MSNKNLVEIQLDAGWIQINRNNQILWFKGYLLNSSVDQLYERFSRLSKKTSPTIDEFQDIVKSIRGHFSFVWQDGSLIFSTVDKVSSIPLFYAKDKSRTIIGNHAPSLKNRLNLGWDDVNYSAALEIAMSGYTINRKTLYHNIFQFNAGECLLLTMGKLKRSFYCTYSPWKVINQDKVKLKKKLTECILHSLEEMAEGLHGRQIVVPLSAGSDSRLIASGLKFLGVKNVFCFSYGRDNSFESKISKNVSEKLGFLWRHISLTSNNQRNFFSSGEFNEYKSHFNTLASVPFLQDVLAIKQLKERNIIDQDAVIVNGNTGDYISGGHMPPSFTNNILNIDAMPKIIESSWVYFLEKNFSLWGVIRNSKNDSYLFNELEELLKDRVVPEHVDAEHSHGLFECVEYLTRQSKYIINMQRSYEFYGYNWRMPLWSDQMMGFWEGVPRIYKINQNLYKNTLKENDWGGVWRDIEINHRVIQPKWIIPLRFMSKILLSPFEIEVWRQFERNAFQYHMDVTRNSVIVPYYKTLFDQRGQRHGLSWIAENYLQESGFNKITKNFP